jgi:hypothetical protein
MVADNRIFMKAAKITHWDYPNAGIEFLPANAFLGGKMNCLLVIDEVFKFSSYRLKTLELYENVATSFSIAEYKQLCMEYMHIADNYEIEKRKKTFNFAGGASAKRAMLDIMMDVLPLGHKLNPTLRLHEFELENITSPAQLESLIASKINVVGEK